MSSSNEKGRAVTSLPDKRYTTKELIRRFLPYYKPYIRTMICDFACAGLTCGAELVLPMIIRYITNTALTNASLLTVTVILKLAFLYFILRVIDSLASFYMAYQGHVMGTYIETDMRTDIYAHLLKLSDTYFNNTKVGQIMGRITSDLFDVTEFAHHCPEEIFIAVIKTVVSFVLLSRISLLFTLLVFAVVPVMLVVCIHLNNRMHDVFSERRYEIGELNARVEDSLLGQKVVKTFTNEKLESEKFEEGNQKFFRVKKKSYWYMAAFQTSTRVFEGIMYLVVILGGGFFLINKMIDAGDLVAYVMYVSTFIATIRQIIQFMEQFQNGITGIERFLQIMDANIDIFDEEGAVPLTDTKGNIELKDVSFAYPDDENVVFTGLNLQIHAGEKVAIVGPSGGGKTTLCNLIPRFYDVSDGEIMLDGKNVKSYTLSSLRGNIGMVQQDVYLFSGTVFENIAYGKPGATREEVESAARRAGADGFVRELKDGYDTYIGERGVKLSGGQKQRLAIARVFLKNPPILILDEATSALDNESEYEVAKSLSALAKDRTTLTIAHRLSSIVHSDRILVLTDKGIVEEGNHEQLMAKKGMYYELYTRANEVR